MFSNSQIWACWHIPWLTCSLTHVPAVGAHTFTPRCRHELRAKAAPARIECLSSPSSLWNPRLHSQRQLPVLEATHVRGSSWRGGWVQCSVISTWWPCPRSGIPRRWMRDSIMPTVDCASPPALRFLGRVAPVCKSSRLGSGPDLSSQWPWGRECLWTHIPTGLGQLLSCESPHMDPCFSPVTRCIYLGSYWAFPTLTLSSELQTTGAVTLGLDSKPWRSFQAHKLSNAVIFFLFLKVKV